MNRPNSLDMPYDWQATGEFVALDAHPAALSFNLDFLSILRESSPARVALANQEAAEFKEKLLSKGVDVNSPQIWLALFEGAKVYDKIIERRLQETEGPKSLAEFDYKSQDDGWLVLSALAPQAIRHRDR